ncbi:MAG: four helix bundle protein [Myxococcales bacterium]|nr:four helix bundle protein [Myxococcales bacterium]
MERYRVTRHCPSEERYGLQAQIRRAAVSVPTNIVAGCARRSTKDDLYFVRVALGSASAVRYLLLGPARRLGLLAASDHEPLEGRYGARIRGLQRLLDVLGRPAV